MFIDEEQIINAEEKALKFLYENYDDTFTPVLFRGESWAYAHSEAVFRSGKFRKNVTVRITEDDGKLRMVDNYRRLLIEEDIVNSFSVLVGKEYAVLPDLPSNFWSQEHEEIKSFSDYALAGYQVIIYFAAYCDIRKDDVLRAVASFDIENGKVGIYRVDKASIDVFACTSDAIFNDYSRIVLQGYECSLPIGHSLNE